MRASVALMVAVLSLAACGTVPVTGETPDGERFAGTFGYPGDGRGGGPFELRSDRGAVCAGRWQLDDDGAGATFLTCEDGRSGTAELSTRSAPGTLRGMLGGKPFIGTFEQPPG
ncbi:hypothetical protein [Reyranella sp.]|uniref:hypothetical protein n=1 Tax=Reyranella sp. TaxID=1929291 RepID=UPI003BAC35A0